MKFIFLSLVFSVSTLSGVAAHTSPCGTRTQSAAAKAVKTVEAAWNKDAYVGNVEKYVSYYAKDALLVPNGPTVSGTENIRAAWEPLFSDPNFKVTFQATQIDAALCGDQVVAVGPFQLTLTNPKDGKPMVETGKYVVLYKKQTDGQWKAVVDIFNSDTPL